MSNPETSEIVVAKGEAVDKPSDQPVAPKSIPRAQFDQYVNRLTPPSGTDYWRHQPITVFDNVDLKIMIATTSYATYETLTWRIDAYVYSTYAQPTDDFAAQGGSIYVVLVHSGSAVTGGFGANTMEYRYNVSLLNPPSGASATKQLPPSDSGVASADGDSMSYPISYTQDMQMFKNNGTDIFTFTAEYEDGVDIHKGIQKGFVKGPAGAQWSVIFNDLEEENANIPFGSVSVFTLSSLEELTFKCDASVWRGSDDDASEVVAVSQNIVVDCRFSTEM